MLYGFSPTSKLAMQAGLAEANARGYDELAAAHVLVGLAQQEGSAREALEALGVDPVELIALCRGRAPERGPATSGALPFDADARGMLMGCADAIAATGDKTVRSAHLLLALHAAGGEGRRIFELLRVDAEALEQAVADVLLITSEAALGAEGS